MSGPSSARSASGIEIRPIVYEAASFAPLLAEARAAGLSFMDRLRDEWLSGALCFDRPGELYLGAWEEDRLLGTGGLSLDPYEPLPGLARVRHVYVLAGARRRGIGSRLMANLLDHGGRHFSLVRLRTHNPDAARMYERLGFAPSDLPGETHRLSL